MKTITIHLEDKEHQELKEEKGKMSWRDFIFHRARMKEGQLPSIILPSDGVDELYEKTMNQVWSDDE